jgi:putative holliday junction resolvase
MIMNNRILAFDFGLKRIGVALSDPMNIIASGKGVLKNDDNLFPSILKILNEYEPKQIVIGMPSNLSGEKGALTVHVLEFTEKIKSLTTAPVIHWDERFTSKIAQNTLLEVGLNKKKRAQKERIDEISAILILQSYIDSQKINPSINIE